MPPNSSAAVPLLPPELKAEKKPDENPLSFKHIRVENNIYSAEKLAAFHPGGPLHLSAFAGQDATEAFLFYHRRRFPHSKVKHALETHVDDEANAKWNHNLTKDFLDLCERVNKVVPRNGGFATWGYYFHATALVAITVGMEMYMHWTGVYRWWISALIGLCHGLIHANIEHEANHGTLSKRPWVNRLWAYTTNLVGLSQGTWHHQHNFLHHIYTNEIRRDPDIRPPPVVRLSPDIKLRWWQGFQHIYFFILLSLFGPAIIQDACFSALAMHYNSPIAPKLRNQCLVDAALGLVYVLRWVVLPLYQQPSFWTILNVYPVPMVMGYWWAWISVISHNWEGTVYIDGEQTDPKKQTMMYKQVRPTSNVGGSFLYFLNGGLSYQIEHHLFPRMNGVHLPKVSPVVKQFCEERGLPYKHFSTIFTNTQAFNRNLYELGNQKIPEAAKDMAMGTINGILEN